MPFVSRRELARLERERNDAIKRAAAAENRLAAERASKDRLIVQLASRVVTKHGQYGLDHEPSATTQPVSPPPRTFAREPTEVDTIRRDYYIKCYAEVGRSEDEAIALWEAEMRGDGVVYPYETEVEQ